VLVEGLHVKWLMVGDDFCYGARRAGNVQMLLEAGQQYGFHVETLPTVMNGSTRISSSAVREALARAISRMPKRCWATRTPSPAM
jgi:riboflavin kinase/FMN adenylyltransferase